MKTPIIQDDQQESSPALPTTQPAVGTRSQPVGSKAPMSGQRLAAVIVASVLALIGVGSLVVGGALLWLDSAKTDSNGYYTSSPHRFATTGRAIVSNGLDANTGELSFLLNDGHIGSLRLTTTPNDPGEELFVGIARPDDVAAYLRDVQQAEVRNVDLDPFNVDYIPLDGDSVPAPPATTDIWAASSVSSSTATLEWPSEPGEWAVVVMNADGSPNVDADVAAAATVPFIFRLGLGLAIGGFVLTIAAIAGVIVARRRPQNGTSLAATPDVSL